MLAIAVYSPWDMGDKEEAMTAAFTIVHNEPFLLSLWLAYYGNQFGFDALTVLDDESDDGSTDHLPCKVRRVENGGVYFALDWLCQTVAVYQANLLKFADVVIYTDVDEFLCHPLGLRRFAEDCAGQSARATGYNLVQTAGEAAYDAGKPILAQRGSWQRDGIYDKTLVSRVPLKWEVGFHFLTPRGNADYAEDLTLVHLHQFDRALAHERHQARRSWPWNELDEKDGDRALQWRLDEQQLDAWLDRGVAGAEPAAGWLKEQVPF